MRSAWIVSRLLVWVWGNEIDDHLARFQGATPPVGRDVAKHAAFDLVPLIRARREMAHRDALSGLIREPLQLAFPQSRPVTIAASGIGGDQQFRSLGIRRLTHAFPPVANAIHRKFCGIMIDAHAHPPLVPPEVIDAMRGDFALFLILEIVRAHRLRLLLLVPLPAPILEIPDQFLFLEVRATFR